MPITKVKVFLPNGEQPFERSADPMTPLKVDLNKDGSITVEVGNIRQEFHGMPFLVVREKPPGSSQW